MTLDLNLTAAWKLSGRVLAADGATTVAGLRIRFMDLAGVRPELNTYSDAQGCYQASLASGTYRIWVTNDWASLNIPHPDFFQIDQPIPDLSISGDMIQDITPAVSAYHGPGSGWR